MGVKSTTEGTGNLIILLIFFPILIAKVMVDKYYKDGFFGLVKSVLGWLFGIVAIIFYFNFYDSITGGYTYSERMEQAEEHRQKSIKYYKAYNIERQASNVDESLLDIYLDSALRYQVDSNDSTIGAKKYLKDLIMYAVFGTILLFLSIKLFISSSNRSRALAKAEKEIIPNE